MMGWVEHSVRTTATCPCFSLSDRWWYAVLTAAYPIHLDRERQWLSLFKWIVYAVGSIEHLWNNFLHFFFNWILSRIILKLNGLLIFHSFRHLSFVVGIVCCQLMKSSWTPFFQHLSHAESKENIKAAHCYIFLTSRLPPQRVSY